MTESQKSEQGKPRVVVSKCLGFDSCRYNGQRIHSEVVEKLKPEVEFIAVCPEVEIGLGVPREPIRVIVEKGEKRLIQPATGKDVSRDMVDFSKTYLSSLNNIDGFLLKNRSPSCGFTDVKQYPPGEKGAVLGKGSGFFGGEVLRLFPHLAVEDEGRLLNFRLREHFLNKLFTLHRFRRAKGSNGIQKLIVFHASHKYLFMSYNQSALKELGKTLASYKRGRYNEVLKDYEEKLEDIFKQPARVPSNINVLMHTLGHFSKQLESEEKAFFLDSLNGYREGKIPLSVPLHLIRAWVTRFGEPYLQSQYFFNPYPSGLMEITDSGKGRDYR